MIGLIAKENAYSEGDATRYYNRPRTDNPYKTETDAYRYWNMGWDERDKEMADERRSAPAHK